GHARTTATVYHRYRNYSRTICKLSLTLASPPSNPQIDLRNRSSGAGLAIGIVLLVVVILAIATNGFTRIPGSTTGTSFSSNSPAPTGAVITAHYGGRLVTCPGV